MNNSLQYLRHLRPAPIALAFVLLLFFGQAWPARAEEKGGGKLWGEKWGPGYVLPDNNFHGASKPFVDASGKECRKCHDDGGYPNGDFFRAEFDTKEILMWGAFAVSAFFFILGVLGKFSIWEIGRKPSFHQRLKGRAMARASLTDVLLGKKILNQSPLRWFIYITISWGFVFLFFAALFLVLMRLVADSPFFLTGPGAHFFDFLCDFLGLVVLAGVAAALVRRYVIRPKYLDSSFEDGAILVSLLLIVLSGFLVEALRIAALPDAPDLRWSFAGYFLSAPFRGLGLSVHWYLWLFHVFLSFGFIMFIPYNKIMHFLAAPLSILATVSEEAHYEERVRHRDVRSIDPVD